MARYFPPWQSQAYLIQFLNILAEQCCCQYYFTPKGQIYAIGSPNNRNKFQRQLVKAGVIK